MVWSAGVVGRLRELVGVRVLNFGFVFWVYAWVVVRCDGVVLVEVV